MIYILHFSSSILSFLAFLGKIQLLLLCLGYNYLIMMQRKKGVEQIRVLSRYVIRPLNRLKKVDTEFVVW